MRNCVWKLGGVLLMAAIGFVGLSFSASGNNVKEVAAKNSVVSDFDTLVRLIEETHPDPYMNYGGRVFFYKKADNIRRELQNDANADVTTLYQKASEFIAQMQDGHSFINKPNIEGADKELGSDSLLVVKFMCGNGSLIVNAIDSVRGDLIGSRLIGINGIPIEELLAGVAISYPCENKFGRLGMLCNWFRQVSFYRNIIDNCKPTSPYASDAWSASCAPDAALAFCKSEDESVSELNADIVMSFLTPDGDTVMYAPKKVHYSQFGEIAKARAPKDERFPIQQMEWKEVEGSMFFRLASVMARENFEFQHKNGWDFYDQLAYLYRLDGKEMPADTVAAIQALPSMSESFLEMLNDMKAKGIKNLVIDLRGNGGGWTPIVLPTLYMMFGDRYLTTDMDAKFYRRISDLYLKKNNTDIATFNDNNGVQLEVGDYLMPTDVKDKRSIEQKRDDFLSDAFCGDSIRVLLASGDGNPIYTPEKIYVVTDEATFSAAFHYAFYLSKLGATVVGETSAQAPNTFMEVTPFTLPLTGLSGSISNAMQVFLPADDPRAKEFTPDITLTYDDYRSYGFDTNSILLHLLNLQQ